MKNKNQEALDFLCDNSKLTQFNIGQSQWASETLQELADKAIPFKPLNQRINHNGLKVGDCKCLYHIDNHRSTNTEVDETYNFCKKCGQAIDWSANE